MLVTVIALVLIIWAMIFSASRCVKYRRIDRLYKKRTTARVVKLKLHPPAKKREPKSYDVVLQYEIDSKEGRSEINVAADRVEMFTVDSEMKIRYYVSGNGAVHIASDTDMFRKLSIAHGAAVAVEMAVFFVIWLKL